MFHRRGKPTRRVTYDMSVAVRPAGGRGLESQRDGVNKQLTSSWFLPGGKRQLFCISTFKV